jgi:glycosyltransferase involved in cell wall biosynthesis
MVKFDSDGLVSARIDPAAFWIENFGNYLERHTAVPVAAALSSAKVAYHVGLPLRDIRLVRGFEPADVLAIESPMAADRLKKYLVRLGRSDLASRVAFVPHPVKEAFAPGDDARRPVHIVAAGRWDSYAKDASLMVRTLALALRASPGFTAVIAGTGETIVRDLVERHARDVADRIDVRGFVEHDAMPGVLRQARVLLVTSRWETFHIAAAEAVCCGCSVVAPASIPSMNHFVSKQSGRLAATRKPEVFAAAVLEELSDWDGGKRNPATIAAAWQKELHVGAVARRMTELLGVA